jgi:hypothetical protein
MLQYQLLQAKVITFRLLKLLPSHSVCKKSALLCAVKCHIDVSFTSRLANSVGCRYIYDRANIYHVSLAKNLGLQHGGTIKAGTG